MVNFKDNFSTQAQIYARYRPHYPVELYQFLSSLTKEHDIAWDCGTGNGQAAIGLSAFYDAVIATDPSEEQIANCFPDPKVTYLVEKAEHFTYSQNKVDLITVANALHWFDLEKFYKVVRHVAKSNGIIAAWSYGIPNISEGIDSVVRQFHDNILGEFWTPENKLVEQEYKTIPFPFGEITCPDFISQKEFDLAAYLTYLNTWSATQKFVKKYGYNPTVELLKQLQLMWVDGSIKKNVTWKIILKVGLV